MPIRSPDIHQAVDTVLCNTDHPYINTAVDLDTIINSNVDLNTILNGNASIHTRYSGLGSEGYTDISPVDQSVEAVTSVSIDYINVSDHNCLITSGRLILSQDLDPNRMNLFSNFGEFFSVQDPDTHLKGKIHLGSFWNILNYFFDRGVLNNYEAEKCWYYALRSAVDNTTCTELIDLLKSKSIPISFDSTPIVTEVTSDHVQDLECAALRMFGDGSGYMSNGNFRSNKSNSGARQEITGEIIDIFKEEGLNAEETRMVLTEMLNKGDISSSMLRKNGPLFKYGDDRRYIVSRVLNKIFELRRKRREMNKRGSNDNSGSFDPSIDVITGRPVGCL